MKIKIKPFLLLKDLWDWMLLAGLAWGMGWFNWYPYGDWMDGAFGGLAGAGVWSMIQGLWYIFGSAVTAWEDRRSFGVHFLETPLNRFGKPFEIGQDATDQICGSCAKFKTIDCPKKIYEKDRPACPSWYRLKNQEL